MKPLGHILALTAVLLVLAPAPRAWACDCLNAAPARAELAAKSSVVFFGTVADLGQGGADMTVTIDAMLKGEQGGRTVATIKNTGLATSCDFFFPKAVGETYLFFDSNLDDINTTGCHSTIFAMDAAPADLATWVAADPDAAGLEEEADEDPKTKEPTDKPEPAETAPVGDTKPASGGCVTSSQVGLPSPPTHAALVFTFGLVAFGLRRRLR